MPPGTHWLQNSRHVFQYAKWPLAATHQPQLYELILQACPTQPEPPCGLLKTYGKPTSVRMQSYDFVPPCAQQSQDKQLLSM